jgi:NAD-dependent DNA ligase
MEFCNKLYEEATIKVMARKYAYYILSESYVSDLAYDISVCYGPGAWHFSRRRN